MKMYLFYTLFLSLLLYSCDKKQDHNFEIKKENKAVEDLSYNKQLPALLIKEKIEMPQYEKILTIHTSIRALVESRHPFAEKNTHVILKKIIYLTDPQGLFISEKDFTNILAKTPPAEQSLRQPPLFFLVLIKELLNNRANQMEKNTSLFTKTPMRINSQSSFYTGKNKPLAINELNLIQNFDSYLNTLAAQISSEEKVSEIEIANKITAQTGLLFSRLKTTTLSELLNHYFNALLVSNDQFSRYLSPEETTYFKKNLQLSTLQFGIEFQQTTRGLNIMKIIKESSAEKAGIKVGDLITVIKTKHDTFVTAIPEQSLKFLNSNSSEEVTFLIKRNNESLEKKVTPTLLSSDKEISFKTIPQGKNKYAYLKIPYFYFTDKEEESLAQKVANLVPQINTHSGLILDLRDNSGGQLNAALDILALFLPKMPLYIEKNKDKEDVIFGGEYSDQVRVKVVVLINHGSASASEIVATALRDNAKALLIGANSLGKGSIQDLINLNKLSPTTPDDLGQIKLTRSTFHRLNGEAISNKGLAPDIELRHENLSANPLEVITVHSAKLIAKTPNMANIEALRTSSVERQTKKMHLLSENTSKLNSILKNRFWLTADAFKIKQEREEIRSLYNQREKLLQQFNPDLGASVIESSFILDEWVNFN